LPIETWIVVCVDAALEDFGFSRSVKEPRRDTQRARASSVTPVLDG
jgi:hypothetical protein